jgi:hypothetical protein
MNLRQLRYFAVCAPTEFRAPVPTEHGGLGDGKQILWPGRTGQGLAPGSAARRHWRPSPPLPGIPCAPSSLACP